VTQVHLCLLTPMAACTLNTAQNERNVSQNPADAPFRLLQYSFCPWPGIWW